MFYVHACRRIPRRIIYKYFTATAVVFLVPSKWMDGFGSVKVFLSINTRDVMTSFGSITITFRPEIDTCLA